MRLLLVEDEEELVSALAKGLRREGYAVDGQAGWAMADVNEYDLVLLDLNLPQMDGIEVCRRLKQSHPQVLILMLTARDLPTQKIAGLSALLFPLPFWPLPERMGCCTASCARQLSRDTGTEQCS